MSLSRINSETAHEQRLERSQIRGLPPSPELDLVVARALGWRIVRHDEDPSLVLGGLPPSAKEGDCFVPIPKFSTTMTAAWAIVTRKLSAFELTQLGSADQTRWICQSDGNDPVVADTAPLAICLTYLRSRRVDLAQLASTACT